MGQCGQSVAGCPKGNVLHTNRLDYSIVILFCKAVILYGNFIVHSCCKSLKKLSIRQSGTTVMYMD